MNKKFLNVLFIAFMISVSFCKSSQLDDISQMQSDLERKIAKHMRSIKELSKQEEEACRQNQPDLTRFIREQKKEHHLEMEQINFKMIQNVINGYVLGSIDKEELDLTEEVIQNRKQLFLPNNEQPKRTYFTKIDCKSREVKRVEVYAHGDRKETTTCYCDLHDKPTVVGIDVVDSSGKLLLEVYIAECY